MVQNPWLIFQKFCAFLANWSAQSAYNSKVVFLIDLVARIYEAPAYCNWRKQWAKPNLTGFFFVLALLVASIGMIGLWFAWFVIFEQIWIVVNISWAMSMRRCFCSKFSNFGTTFFATRFMPKTCVKIAWHDLNCTWSQSFQQDYNLVCNTIYVVVCVYFMHKRRDLIGGFLRNFSLQFYLLSNRFLEVADEILFFIFRLNDVANLNDVIGYKSP